MFFRVLALVLALGLCSGALASGLYAVNAGGVAALVDADGASVLEGDFQTVFEVRPGALYAAGAPGAYELYDAAGSRLFGPFEMIDDMGGALIFRRGGLYGAVDEAGAMLVEPEWTQLTWGGGFLALQGNPLDEQPDEVLALAEGGASPTGIYTESGLAPFFEGRMVYRAADGRYGCLDGAGNAAIPAEWGCIGDFQDGAAIVSDGAMYGLIGADGGPLTPVGYVWLQRGADALFGLREDGVLEALSPDGSALCRIDAGGGAVSVAGDHAAVGGTLYDLTGAAVFAGSGDALYFPGLDGQVILSDGPWGSACETLLDPDGRAASKKYQRILPLTAGRYAFMTFEADMSDVRCGLLDAAGRELSPAVYNEIIPLGQDRLALVSDGAVVFADIDGREIKRIIRTP